MKQHLIRLGFLLGALACWVGGSFTGMLVFGAVGLLFESVFWFRLFRRRRPELPADQG